jgi:hypothetical protein
MTFEFASAPPTTKSKLVTKRTDLGGIANGTVVPSGMPRRVGCTPMARPAHGGLSAGAMPATTWLGLLGASGAAGRSDAAAASDIAAMVVIRAVRLIVYSLFSFFMA